MASHSSLENGRIDKAEQSPMFRPRAYQEEMLSESLRQNIIVAMDTGSGKTQIAILRIREELGRCPGHKLAWFTAPTVALARQQHTVISQQLPAFQTRMLSGADNVDHWSTQRVWDDLLLNIRIVISTPQVLLSALSNGFINLTRVALLIFDEAHHCVASSPENMIMQNFYHDKLQRSGTANDLPSILGLTASPITRKLDGLEKIEKNLNAICKTPKIHREELLQFVHRPQLCRVVFQKDHWWYSPMIQGFSKAIDGIDIWHDPLVRRLAKLDSLQDKAKLQKVLCNKKTPCLTQLRAFLNRATVVHDELGPWASDTYMAACIKIHSTKNSNSSLLKLTERDKEDDTFISEILSQIPITPGREIWNSVPDLVSEKANQLISLLVAEYTPEFTGIIFARERSTVVMLSHLISRHPLLSQIVAGPFVGESSSPRRKSSIYELTHPRDQKDTISELRSGKKNLLIATSVLEEGIDISACHLVVCFDPLTNLRSFIQRRGRARKETSKFVIFLDEADRCTLSKWTEMENLMKDMYSDEMRRLVEIQQHEAIEEFGADLLRIESTGALLTLENARQHLEHFCSTVSYAFTASRPEFMVTEFPTETFSAVVILPTYLDPQFRKISGSSTWRTEKWAKRDASFQAYKKLYEAGLVNDHLLPVHCEVEEQNTVEHVEKRPSVVEVSERLNPWLMVAVHWQSAKLFYQSIIDITSDVTGLPRMYMVLPLALPCDISFRLFWNEEVTFSLSLKQQQGQLTKDIAHSATRSTRILLSSRSSSRIDLKRTDFSCLFIPDTQLAVDSIEKWCNAAEGTIPAEVVKEHDAAEFGQFGLVRTTLDHKSRPWILEKCVMRPLPDNGLAREGEEVQEIEELEVLHVEGRVWPKRTDFLHPVANTGNLNLHHTARICHPARDCLIDKLPVGYAMFALFVPSIIHNLEIFLVADQLAKTILAPVGFENLNLLVTSISSSSAREATNYQRLEFLGDSLLKFHTSLQLSAANALWHEGLLSKAKDNIVSNTRLSKAAVKTGLDKFILVKAFTGLKWRPPYNSDHLNLDADENPTREMSTKVLADVIEALIGAADIDGGKDRTMNCLKVFLPEVDWICFNKRIDLLYNMAASATERTPTALLREIEALLGYTFQKKMLLLEAFTHPCSQELNMSYQRLEFLGDSVLDHIVVQALFGSPITFAHHEMHLMRAALVNADFLAFLCMGTSTAVLRGELAEDTKGNPTASMTTQTVYLWQFMRHPASSEIAEAQEITFKRYEELCGDISQALEHSITYPWALLSRLDSPKFFSDLIESVLGGIFVDSHGSLEACKGFLERIGLMHYLRRVLTGQINLIHPKERLGLVAGNLKVRYETRLFEDSHGLDQRYICQVLVGDEVVAQADDGVSRIEVETKAAEEALAVLDLKQSSLMASDVPV